MGGHSAWRKRVAAGGLAKGSGGAALRHRPRLGRRGDDLALNRLGNLGGHGNPKRKNTKKKDNGIVTSETLYSNRQHSNRKIFIFTLIIVVVCAYFIARFVSSRQTT